MTPELKWKFLSCVLVFVTIVEVSSDKVGIAKILENKEPGSKLTGVTSNFRSNSIRDWNHFNHHARLIHHGDRDPKYLSKEHILSQPERREHLTDSARQMQMQMQPDNLFIVSNE